MIYNKKKDSFKKTRQQIFHKEANKTILNMIAQRIQGVSLQEVDSNILQPQQTLPKTCLSPNRQYVPSKTRLSEGKVQNLVNVSRQTRSKIQKLRIQHPIDIKLKSQGKAEKIKQQYINILQEKINTLENSQKQSKKSINTQYMNKILHLQQQARALLLQNCMELIQCKVALQGVNEVRIKSINSILGKNQQYIQVQAALLQKKDTSINYSQETQIQQLQQICKYQEKIIKHLRQTKVQQSPINQLQLLRHQINRVSIDNQKLRQMVFSVQSSQVREFSAKKSIESNSSISYLYKVKKSQKIQQCSHTQISTQTLEMAFPEAIQKSKKNQFYASNNNEQIENIIKQQSNAIRALKKQIQSLKLQIQKEKEIAYKLSIEKQYLIDMVEQEGKAKEQIAIQQQQIKKLASHIEKIESHNKKLEKQNKIFTMKQNASTSINKDQNIDYGNLSSVIRSKLQKFPSAFETIYPCLKQYLDRMNHLRQAIQQQTDKNQSIIKWSREIYQQLQNFKQKVMFTFQRDKQHSSQFASLEQDIQKIKFQDYFNLQLDNDKISELLRKIKALSIGIEEFEIKDMQQQLQQYVATLKGRNQAIREVQNEDGSSVHARSINHEGFYEENQ